MKSSSRLGKFLRFFGVLMMGITAVITLLSGIGTSCVALAAETYESMAVLAPYKWLYQVLVVLTIATAIAGIRATIGLIKHKDWSYRAALTALLAGLVLAGIQIAASRALRGKSQPNDMRFYITLITLLVFLVWRIPRIWSQIRITGGGSSSDSGSAAGVTMIVSGIAFLTIHVWAGPTHTFGGFNYADIWRPQLSILGWGLAICGLGMLAWFYGRLGRWIEKVLRQRGMGEIRI